MHWHFIKLSKIDHILFILSIFIVFIPFSGIAFYISLPIALTFCLIVALSILFYIKSITIKGWIVNTLSVFLLIFPFLNFTIEDIVLPSVEALTLITAVRFLGNKTSREYLQIYLLSLLLLGALSLFTLSWVFLLRLGLILILCIFSVLLITYLRESSNKTLEGKILFELLKYAAGIFIISIPLSVLFFLFLPRTPFPLLDVGLAKAKTGFSSTVNLGGISTIEEDKTVVMRVKMDKIDSSQLYWRMITFDNFDGKNWTRRDFDYYKKISITGEKIIYTVFFEPSEENYLPVLDLPSKVFMQNLVLEYPMIFKIRHSIDRYLKYQAESLLKYTFYEEAPSDIYLQIPKNISHRIISLTEELTLNHKDRGEIIDKIMNFLKTYEYSLKTLPKGDNPVEDFIFNTKKGNCEYFATTMALMLRIKGIPSRVVGGFRGGSYNPFGGYYIVRASDAHLWVEAWIDGLWIRYDPSSGRNIRYSEPVILNFLDYLWNNIIINYDLNTQVKILKAIKPPKFDFEKKYLLILLFPLIFLIVLYVLREYEKTTEPLKVFLKIMRKAGFKRMENQGLEDFLYSIPQGPIKDKAGQFVEKYCNIYFRDKKFTHEDRKTLKRLLKQLDETIKNSRS